MFKKIKYKKSNKSICKLLSQVYGGKWKHFPFHNMWYKEDEDNYAIVSGTCSADEFENVYFTGYYYYGCNGAEFLGWDLRYDLECKVKNDN